MSSAGTMVVTGTTGFVGSRLVTALRAAGVAVTALDRAALDLSIPPSAGALATMLAGARAVVHVAAYIPRDHRDPGETEPCHRVNALGTLALVRAAVDAGIPRFVYVSSGNIYRWQPRLVSEDDPVYPSARAPYYLASKLAGELYVDHLGRTTGLATAIARVSSVYGRGMAAGGMVPRFLAALRAGESVQVQDGGAYRTDLVHIDDVVAGLVALAGSDVRGPMNLGSGAAPSTLEVARTLCAVVGVGPERVTVVDSLDGTDDAGGARGFAPLAIDRARRELGYDPRAIAQGLAEMAAADS